jgi:hypothetical protein
MVVPLNGLVLKNLVTMMVRANIMPEHRELMLSLVNKVYGEN